MDTAAVLDFVMANRAALPYMAAALAAAETVAFLSIFIPATALLMAVGASVSTGALPFLPIWIGAAIGAVIGSTFSYGLGRWFGPRLLQMWPLAQHADTVDRARALFLRHGPLAIVIGHFVGPVRPVAFLFAGISGISFRRFMVFNVLGATAWAFVVPKTGELGGDLIGWFWTYLGF